MAMSWYLANKVLDDNLKTSEPESATPHLWLHTGDPGAGGTVNVAQTDAPANIVRKALTMEDAAAAGTGEQEIANTAKVEWTGAQIDSGQTITHFTIWSALEGGNCLFIAAVDTQKETGSDGVEIAIGDLEAAISVHAVEPA